MNKNIVYMYTFPNGKRYIGITNNETKRKNEHKNDHINKNCKKYNYLFYKALRKYGFENVKYEVIYRSNDYNEVKNMEKFYIQQYNTFHKNGMGYNCTLGGDGTLGYVYTDEHRKKIRITSTGRIKSDKTKKIMSEKFSGKNNPMFNHDLNNILSKPKTRSAFRILLKNRPEYSFEDFEEILAPYKLWRFRKNGTNEKKYYYKLKEVFS